MQPLTFLYVFPGETDQIRPYIFQEFAQNGVKNLVFSDQMLARCLQNFHLPDTLKSEMEQAGLKFVDSHAVFGQRIDLNTPDERDRGIAVQRLKLSLEIIAYMGVDTVTVHVGNNAWMDEKYRSLEQNVERIEDSLSQVLPTAEKTGVTICIENIWYPTNTPEVLLKIKEHFPTDALGFCYDAGHANICAKGYMYESGGRYGDAWRTIYGKDPVWDDQIGEKMLPHIVNCHLHDNYGEQDQHFAPGNGNVDWKKTTDLLRRAPRLKNIQSEVILLRDNISIRSLAEKFRQILPECF